MTELAHRRTRTSKTFLIGDVDGKKQYRLERGGGIYHRPDPENKGRWLELDLLHEEVPRNISPDPHGKQFSHFISRAAQPVELNEATGAMRVYFTDNCYVDLGGASNLQGQYSNNGKPKVDRSLINYDVEYTVFEGGVKRWWRLKKQPTADNGLSHQREFKSPVNFVGCYYMFGYVIEDGTNKILGSLLQPFCYEESKGADYFYDPATSQHSCSMRIENNEMIVNVDTTGLIYPVIVDPTLSITTGAEDSYAWGLVAWDDRNYGASQTLFIRYMSTSHPSNTTHGFIRFDASAIPSGATINSATLSMYQLIYTPIRQYALERITETDWVGGTAIDTVQAGSVSWVSRRHGITTWSTPGGTSTTTDRAVASVSGANAWVDWDITNLMQWFLDNAGGIIDLLIKDSNETGAQTDANQILNVRSNDSTGSEKPKLEVIYTLLSGNKGFPKSAIIEYGGVKMSKGGLVNA